MKKMRKRTFTFRTSKQKRKEILGNCCELCGEPYNIGHHRKGKGRNGVFEIGLRCWKCEHICHDESRKGNPRWAEEIHRRNDSIIRAYGHMNRNCS